MKRKARQKSQRTKAPRNLKLSKAGGWWFTVSILFFFLLGGCGGGTSPTSLPEKKTSPAVEKKQEEAQKGAEKKESEKKEPGKKEEVEYVYNPAGKPDPFKPFIQLTPIKKTEGPLTPLQKYDISQLTLVAIISTPEGSIALVEDGTKKGYFLKKGTLIGKNDGKVTKILRDRVIIEEVYEDIFGKTKTSEISLFLQKIEEGGGES